MKVGVYQILNTQTGKVYVGSSCDLIGRFYGHRWDLNQGQHHSRHLQRAWDRYGEAAFLFLVLEIVLDRSSLITREQYYIDLLQSSNHEFGYNICPDAASCLGKAVSSETREKISIARQKNWEDPDYRERLIAAHRGKFQSFETRAKHSVASLGRKHTPEACEAMSIKRRARICFPHTPEHNAKISASLLGRPRSPETRAKISAGHRRRLEIDITPQGASWWPGQRKQGRQRYKHVLQGRR